MKRLEPNSRKRKAEGGFVHARTGPPPCCFEQIFFRIWGLRWRARLEPCSSEKEWRSGCKECVKAVCYELKLGEPYPGDKMDSATVAPRERDQEDKEVLIPRTMNRDD